MSVTGVFPTILPGRVTLWQGPEGRQLAQARVDGDVRLVAINDRQARYLVVSDGRARMEILDFEGHHSVLGELPPLFAEAIWRCHEGGSSHAGLVIGAMALPAVEAADRPPHTVRTGARVDRRK